MVLSTALHQLVPLTAAKPAFTAKAESWGSVVSPFSESSDTGPGAGHTSRAQHQEVGGHCRLGHGGKVCFDTHKSCAHKYHTQTEFVRVRTLLGRNLKSKYLTLSNYTLRQQKRPAPTSLPHRLRPAWDSRRPRHVAARPTRRAPPVALSWDVNPLPLRHAHHGSRVGEGEVRPK